MGANCNPLDIGTVFGDPDALQKAAENMALYPYCIKKDMHCPWVNRCSSDPNWICPLDLEERKQSNDKTESQI